MHASLARRIASLILPCLMALPIAAHAQGVVFPQSIVLPNYNRVLIGQQQGLEGGAYVARVGDAAANWYNPAGLALSEKSGLEASATSYDWTTLTAEGLGQSTKRAKFSAVGGFVGGVLGAPVIDNDRLRYGFGIATPVMWRGSLDTAFPFPVTGGTERFALASDVDFTVRIPAVNAGYALSDRVRVGAGLGVAMIGLAQSQALGDQLLAGGTYASSTRAYSTEGTAYALALTTGAQWNVTQRITVGAIVRAPSVGITGGTQIDLQSSTTADSATTDYYLRDEEAKFEYRMPLEGDLGIALTTRDAHAGIEFNVRAYASVDRYSIFSTTVPLTTIHMDSTGAAAASNAAVTDLTTAARSVVDLSFGGHIDLKPGHRIHAGVFTDNSPVADGESPFRQVDFTGGSLGYSITGARLSGSLGLAYLHGVSQNSTSFTLLSGTTAQGKIIVDTFNVFYALSFKF